MSDFNTTQNDTAKALSQNFPRFGVIDNIDWEAVEFAEGLWLLAAFGGW